MESPNFARLLTGDINMKDLFDILKAARVAWH